MPEWGVDSTRRFLERPFYQAHEIEEAAERIIAQAAGKTAKTISHPLDDSALERILELVTDDSDFYADFSTFDAEVDGYTVFSLTGAPRTFINVDLAKPNFGARRRMTLAHELGHVILHQPLYRRDARQLSLLQFAELVPVYCERSQIVRSVDWCEWQAAYFAGVMLMPTILVRETLREGGISEPAREGTSEADQLTKLISTSFSASHDAARVRLAQLGFLTAPSRIGLQQF